MLRTSASSRILRVCVLGLATVTAAVIFTTDTADARRRHRHHRHHHHTVKQSYNPAFASIIVDANSGATLTATNADGLRFPASLTKIMTLYLLFERLDAGKVSLNTEMPVSAHAASQAP
ncbi:MAG: peptidase M15, partial [Rhizobiales bacterium]|nr:peptidase M15 [Hyphomicrobiales bacterium]